MVQKHEAYGRNLETNIDELREEASETKQIGIEFIPYEQIPYFYAILVGGTKLATAASAMQSRFKYPRCLTRLLVPWGNHEKDQGKNSRVLWCCTRRGLKALT